MKKIIISLLLLISFMSFPVIVFAQYDCYCDSSGCHLTSDPSLAERECYCDLDGCYPMTTPDTFGLPKAMRDCFGPSCSKIMTTLQILNNLINNFIKIALSLITVFLVYIVIKYLISGRDKKNPAFVETITILEYTFIGLGAVLIVKGLLYLLSNNINNFCCHYLSLLSN